MRRLIAFAATAVLSASPLLVNAAGAAPEYSKEGGCGPGESKTARGIFMIGDGKSGGHTLYIDDRDYVTGDGHGLWIYEEDNKYDFLQRGGKAAVDATGGGSELCQDPAGVPAEEQTTDELGNPTWKGDLLIF